jgi:HK97 family phage major capsid protein
MNVDMARARRAEIIYEQEALVAGKTRLSRADQEKFNALQDEFRKRSIEINKGEEELRANGVWTGGIIHDDAPMRSSTTAPLTDPVAQGWVRAVRDRRADVGGELRALTLSGDLTVDVPLAPIGLPPERPRYIADVVSRKTIDGPTGTWLRQTAFTNNAAVVAKGAEKPESALTLTRETADLSVLAHLITGLHVVDLDDESNLQSVIGNRLYYGLKLELDDQIVNGNGMAPNLQGILDAGSGVSTVSFAGDFFSTLRYARTELELENVQAKDIVMNPNDVQALDLTLDDVAQFYFGGPIQASEDGTRVWSARVISSPVIAEGTAVMGDLAQAITVITHETGVRIAWDPFTGFSTNTVDVRCEMRAAVAFTAPYALRIVELV